MRYRPLGTTGLEVSEIGFGCASWWANPAFDERQAVALVHAALEGGITLFDTGASYGAGLGEARLGAALRGRDASRLVVATKAGTHPNPGGRPRRDFSPAAVEASVERSLRKLGLDHLPVLQLHGPSVQELEGGLMERLERLRERGLVRVLGVNSFDPEVIARAIELDAFGVVMLDYNLALPEREPLIARAAAAGTGVLAGAPLAMGQIGLGFARIRRRRDLWYAARALLRERRSLRRGARFSFLHRLEGMSAAQAALCFVLGDPGVSAAVLGTSRQSHLAQALAAPELALPDGTRARIAAVQRGFVRDGPPLGC